MDSLNEIKRYIENSIEVKQQILQNKALQQTLTNVIEKCTQALTVGHRIFIAGNGGSAADAQHIAAELVSRFFYDRPGLPAIALTTDTSILTAVGNDYGYEFVFSRQIQALANAGDIFIGITTSGNSKNILLAIEEAKNKGVYTVGLSGNKGAILDLADTCLAVPSDITPHIQEAHIMIGHLICAMIEQTLFPKHDC